MQGDKTAQYQKGVIHLIAEIQPLLDEYTRWLTLRRENRDLSVAFGWATIEGWAISPSDLSEYASGLPGFMPDEPIVLQTFYLPRFLSNLRQCQALLHDKSRLEQKQGNMGSNPHT